MKAKIFYLFGLLLLICACSQKNGGELSQIHSLKNLNIFKNQLSPTMSIHIKKDQQFGENDDVMFSRMGAVEVDNLNQVYITERAMGMRTIHQFSSDGAYLTSIGTEGDGPGEYRTIGNIKVESNKLFVHDVVHQRISMFSLDSHSLSGEINLNPTDGMMSFGQFFILNNGNILIGFEDPGTPNIERYIHFYIIDPQGFTRSKKIVKFRIEDIFQINFDGHRTAGTLPFGRTTLVTVSKDDLIYSAWTEKVLIKVYDLEGQYFRGFKHPYRNAHIDQDAFFNELTGRAKDAFRQLNIPDTHPALNSMLADDEGRVWVSTIIDSEKLIKWWVLEETGELITKFEWPRDEPIEVIKNGYMYTRETDEETGLQQVVRYRIEMTEAK